MNPLLNVFLGMIFFRERLTVLQWVAFALAAAGVLSLAATTGTIPWISLALAVTFGLYGLVKKTAGLDSLEALGAETLLLAPLALAYLFFRNAAGPSLFDHGLPVLVLLSLSGVVTALPMLAFAIGARLLPLSLLGFIQYLSPTMQLALGILVFGEPFPKERLIAFALVWTALLFYSASYLPRFRPGPGRSPENT
jgi:chloramphenicol-sensitive protein RarD